MTISMVRLRRIIMLAAALSSGSLLSPWVNAEAVDDDGAVHISDLIVPLSDLMSPEARAYMRHLLVDHPFAGGPSAAQDIKGYRARQDQIMREFLAPMQARYKVTHREQIIAGVTADVVTPEAGIKPGNAHRVLINLHGGGFISGARTAALVESIPIAAQMGIEVISVDYRLSPEAHFPAASEDVAAVYRELLKRFKPSQVGIYGCSAGGILAAQAVTWFQSHGLPRPGALGVMCASLGEDFLAGDSGVTTWPLNGIPSPPRSAPGFFETGYFQGVRQDDPLARPAYSPSILGKFPATILITGTRSMEFSAVIHSHNALTQAGVEAELHVWDGLPHGFMYNSELPESREVYEVMARFFDKHLSH